jgi:hypothetical protein
MRNLRHFRPIPDIAVRLRLSFGQSGTKLQLTGAKLCQIAATATLYRTPLCSKLPCLQGFEGYSEDGF